MPDTPPATSLLEQIAAQQARVSLLNKRLQAAERAVQHAVTPAASAVAHRGADAALIALEAAEGTLRRLTIEHTAVTARPDLAPASRRSPTLPAVDQAALFDVG